MRFRQLAKRAGVRTAAEKRRTLLQSQMCRAPEDVLGTHETWKASRGGYEKVLRRAWDNPA